MVHVSGKEAIAQARYEQVLGRKTSSQIGHTDKAARHDWNAYESGKEKMGWGGAEKKTLRPRQSSFVGFAGNMPCSS